MMFPRRYVKFTAQLTKPHLIKRSPSPCLSCFLRASTTNQFRSKRVSLHHWEELRQRPPPALNLTRSVATLVDLVWSTQRQTRLLALVLHQPARTTLKERSCTHSRSSILVTRFILCMHRQPRIVPTGVT